MNDKRIPPARNYGGAERKANDPRVRPASAPARPERPRSAPATGAGQARPRQDMPRAGGQPRMGAGYVRLERPPVPNAQNGRAGYTQMPLRPMTSIQGSAAVRSPQRRAPEAIPVRDPTKKPTDKRRPPVSNQQRSPDAVGVGRPAAAPRQERPERPVQKRPPVQEPKRPPRPPMQTGPRPNATQPSGGQPRSKGNARVNRQAPPKRIDRAADKRPNNGWVVPEGSAVYTAEGRMYDTRRARPPYADGGKAGAERKRPPEARRPAPKKKGAGKEKFLFFVKTFFIRLLVMLLIVSLLGVWWYRAEFFSDSSRRSGSVTFALDSDRAYETKASVAYRGEVLYVDFTEIATWFGMVSVGSVNSMRFICTEGISETSSGKGGEEYAIFTSGSTTVLVNGSSISMESVCRTVDSHIWVPLSFVERYVVGVVCDRGAKGTDITFAPEGIDMETIEKDEEIKISASFKVKAQNAVAHVKYPEEEGDQNG